MNANTPDKNSPPAGEPVPNRQAGHALGDGDPATAGEVAFGDRRDEVHFEPDANQLVRAEHLVRPTGPLPPQDDSLDAEAEAEADVPPIEDVKVAPEGPSVWDARPTST